jgi:hypothetical protein
LAETPYVCLRLLAGGGKTFLAARAVKVGAKFLERENNPLVLWLMPTDAIWQQTLETLDNPKHPNQEQLDADFDGKLRIVDIADFSLLTPQDLRDKACIVVGTFAALRVEGTLPLLVIKKSPGATLKAGIFIAGFQPESGATTYSYGIPQDEATRSGTGSPDIAQAPFTGASAEFPRKFSPYSATVIVLSPLRGN